MNVITATDLLYPGQQDPIGLDHSGNTASRRDWQFLGADPLRYVAWVPVGRGHGEHAPRLALHLVICRNGAGGGS